MLESPKQAPMLINLAMASTILIKMYKKKTLVSNNLSSIMYVLQMISMNVQPANKSRRILPRKR